MSKKRGCETPSDHSECDGKGGSESAPLGSWQTKKRRGEKRKDVRFDARGTATRQNNKTGENLRMNTKRGAIRHERLLLLKGASSFWRSKRQCQRGGVSRELSTWVAHLTGHKKNWGGGRDLKERVTKTTTHETPDK